MIYCFVYPFAILIVVFPSLSKCSGNEGSLKISYIPTNYFNCSEITINGKGDLIKIIYVSERVMSVAEMSRKIK